MPFVRSARLADLRKRVVVLAAGMRNRARALVGRGLLPRPQGMFTFSFPASRRHETATASVAVTKPGRADFSPPDGEFAIGANIAILDIGTDRLAADIPATLVVRFDAPTVSFAAPTASGEQAGTGPKLRTTGRSGGPGGALVAEHGRTLFANGGGCSSGGSDLSISAGFDTVLVEVLPGPAMLGFAPERCAVVVKGIERGRPRAATLRNPRRVRHSLQQQSWRGRPA